MLRPARPVLAAVAVALTLSGTAAAHPERITAFTFPASGHVPDYRAHGPSNVVCKSNSRKLVKREFKGNRRLLKRRLATLSRCRYHDIQSAINAAKSGYRVLIMPGTYKEQPSRNLPPRRPRPARAPKRGPPSRNVPRGGPGQPPCQDQYVTVEEGYGQAPPPAGPRSN